MAINEQKQILIAPLDWGLGHTTRCIPLIKQIQRMGHSVIMAGNHAQRSFIEGVLPGIEFVSLHGYNVTYSKWNKYARLGLLMQLPHIKRCIAREHEWLNDLVARRRIDGIISDNRYGLFHYRVPAVIITHQLFVRSGFGNISDRILQSIHNRYLTKFTSVWVPDSEAGPGLAGKLSHPALKPPHTQYIGLLSRYADIPSAAKNKALLVLISGPEPQRTALSKILWQQVQQYQGDVIFAEGSESASPPPHIPPNITYHKRLNGNELETALTIADMVISRSGYSTLMDLVALGKKAVVIPTPGQTEQEYLGNELHKKGIFYCAVQNNFDINDCLKEASYFPFLAADMNEHFSDHIDVVNRWLNTL